MNQATYAADLLSGGPPRWRRERSNALPKHPHERHLDNEALGSALAARVRTIGSGAPTELLHVDKASGGFRVVRPLDLLQRALLAALVDRVLPGATVAADEFESYSAFESAPIEDEGRFVVVADVAHFYDYIPHAHLAAELAYRGGEIRAVTALVELLKAMSGSHHGVPQTYPSSHLLADAFIDQVHRSMLRSGFRVWRYSDDFRISCDDFGTATRSLEELSKRLRGIGLALNDQKCFRYGRLAYARSRRRMDRYRQALATRTGGLGDWSAATGSYDEAYDDEAADEPLDSTEVSEAHALLSHFNSALTSQERVLPEVDDPAIFTGLLATTFSAIARTSAPSLDPSAWMRNLPALTPWILRIIARSDDHREARELARALTRGELHLSPWQEAWLAHSASQSPEVVGPLSSILASVWQSSPSSFARAKALSALVQGGGPSAEVLQALGEEFNRGTPAAREVIAGVLQDLDDTPPNLVGVANGDAVYSLIARG